MAEKTDAEMTAGSGTISPMLMLMMSALAVSTCQRMAAARSPLMLPAASPTFATESEYPGAKRLRLGRSHVPAGGHRRGDRAVPVRVVGVGLGCVPVLACGRQVAVGVGAEVPPR